MKSLKDSPLILEEIDHSVRLILNTFPEQRVFTFEGEMGSGKTTLIKAISTSLGSKSMFSSPTFNLVNEYELPSSKIYHFDLYRINNEEELLDIGFSEYLDSGEYCFIEWPQIAKRFLPKDYVRIQLKLTDNNHYFSASQN